MLAKKYLSQYPTPSVIDPSINISFNRTASNMHHSREVQAATLFRVFLDITGQHLHAMGLEQSLPALSRQYCGFIHTRCLIGGDYDMVRAFEILIAQFCDDLSITPPPRLELSKVRTTTDIEECLIEYQKLKIDQDRISYYTGWRADCSVKGSQFWNLAAFHEQYGAPLTKQLWRAIKDHCNKTIKTTAGSYATNLQSLLTTIIQLYPTEADLSFAGTYRNVNTTVRNIFASQLIDTKQRGKSVKGFYKPVWPAQVRLIKKIFIDSGLWSEPPLPLWCPKFKVSLTNAGTHKHLDEQGNAFNDKLITHIPLSYTDDQTIEALLESIKRDIEHVTDACRQQAEITMSKHTRRKEIAALGSVKQAGVHHKSVNAVDMGIEANRCATLEHYGYNSPTKNYGAFLGVYGKVTTFVQNNALLTPFTLYPFLYLLVEQHHEITDSWFMNFELYDKNGKKSGFQQSGNVWIAESVKRRRGEEKAQQIIVLNETSKALFENIIALTERARQHLREKGDDSWRYLLLSSKSGISAPSLLDSLKAFGSGALDNAPLRHVIAQPSAKADSERAEGILNNLSLTTYRASCGVRVYLTTRSVKAMSEALGHTEYQPKLLSHYLPEPILRYFQARWIRIFQNALVYEAMQDSDYLLDTLDFGEEDLDEFLRNHKLKPLPEHVMTGQVSDFIESNETDEKAPSDNATIPISAPVLQIMNCLVGLVESANESQEIKGAAARWYETSKYVLETIDTQCDCPDIEKAMSDALANPLPTNKLMGAVYAS